MSAKMVLIACLLSMVGTGLAAQDIAPCPADRPLRGELGIEGLRCAALGGSCAINLRDPEDGTYHHDFSVEPVITALDPASETARAFRIGDGLVAVDRVLVTTRAGGRLLANLSIGEEVRVLIRRGGELLEIRLTAEAGCGLERLSVTVG